jgi:glycosyltransferase involved in cell wall biosynthesis
VVVPLYNKRDHVERALTSILGQSFECFEVLVVDDSSTDGSGEIVRRHARSDLRVRLIEFDRNSGPGAARNRGLAEALAPLITFLDADDEWYPDFLERNVSAFDNQEAIDLVASSFHVGPEKLDRWDALESHASEGIWSLTESTTDDEVARSFALLSGCSVLYRTEVVERFGGFFADEKVTLGEDVYLWVRLIFNCAIYRLRDPLAWYHTEVGELGLGSGREDLSLEPVFTQAQRVRADCPPLLRPKLDRWLALHALRAAHRNLSAGNADRAAWLLDAFPDCRRLGREYWKARAKLAILRASRVARASRRPSRRETA